ncbi:MAG: capsule assembly Wzi family protein [Candidatus Methylomirabilia bacterium]
MESHPRLCEGQYLTGLVFFLALVAGVASFGWAGDRTNVPLKNWGGFAVSRHWIYDDLERLALSGLPGRVVLNTKPLSRMEAARIVARAVETIRGDRAGLISGRAELEAVLNRLIEEFGPELATMGVRVPGVPEAPSTFFFKPVDTLQLQAGYADRETSPSNSLGAKFLENGSSRIALQGRAQIGDFLSFYVYPEFEGNDGSTSLRLIQGYAKLSLWHAELLVGRDSLWWGPGFRGSMLFSNNAPPLDMIKLSTDAFVPPWLFKYMGPTKLTLAAVRLEENREFPEAKVLGFRINSTPFSFLELGFSPAIQFNGRGQPSVEFYELPELIWKSRSSSRTGAGGKFGSTNTLFSLDATLRLANTDRYLPIGRDVALYGELGFDDIDFRVLEVIVIPRKPAFLVGTFIQNPFLLPRTNLRFEYTQTSSISFTHGVYRDGFSFEGRPISHFIGTGGRDVYLRVTRWLTGDLLLGLESGYSQVGSTRGEPILEKRLFSGLDLSYRLPGNLSLFGRFQLQQVDNLDFVQGQDDTVPAFFLEATYRF